MADEIKKEYKPQPIPCREQRAENGVNRLLNLIGFKLAEPAGEPFAEVEIKRDDPDCVPVPVLPIQPVKPAADEKRLLFYAMRQVAADNLSFSADNSKAFYYQALFMKDFEDDWAKQEQFSSYYPYYQQMNYGQLRTYFTWRTQVRKGNVAYTSLSYAFLYIYELLNHIGVSGCEDGLEKLLAFWRSFRAFDTALDRYVLQWLKDCHIYYPLPRSFREFAAANGLLMYYPTVFGYDSGEADSFDLFAGVSKYNIKNSVFYNEQTRPMIARCFYFILSRFRACFQKKKKRFEDLIFYPLARESIWIPFSRSLFYPVFKQLDRQIAISEKEIYHCRRDRWTYQTVILSERGRQLVGYIMKEMESCLRISVKYKHKLFANPDMCDGKIRIKLENAGIALPRFIQECVFEFYAGFTRKTVSVDIESLKQIRQEALQTQEKLIIPEEADIAQSKYNRAPAVVLPILDSWAELKEVLTQLELEALKVILYNKDIKAFTAENRIMPEVLIDGINQKAADCLNDTVLEIDDTVTVYEEYREKLMGMVEN